MRIMLDANIILDCLVLEANGQPRPGKAASDQILTLCDQRHHDGLVAWHTLPIVAYYYRRQCTAASTNGMMDALMAFLTVPTVGHADAINWRHFGIVDFEDALQLACAAAGRADVFITRNIGDFTGSPLPIMTPETFLATYP
jgi:PIN domain